MERNDVIRLAKILAIQAEVEAMKVRNQLGAITNPYPIFTFADFNQKADELRQLANAPDDELRNH